jgi:hypothetical protein
MPDLNMGLLGAPGNLQQVLSFQFETFEKVKWDLQLHRVRVTGRPILTPTPEPQTLQGTPDTIENAQARGRVINANESVVDFLQLEALSGGANAEAVG